MPSFMNEQALKELNIVLPHSWENFAVEDSQFLLIPSLIPLKGQVKGDKWAQTNKLAVLDKYRGAIFVQNHYLIYN